MVTTTNVVMDYDAATGETVMREMTAEELAVMPDTLLETADFPDPPA